MERITASSNPAPVVVPRPRPSVVWPRRFEARSQRHLVQLSLLRCPDPAGKR